MIRALRAKFAHVSTRAIVLISVAVGLLGLFLFVGLRTGPFAPVPVTVATVSTESIRPRLFGLGTIEARRTARVGPTSTGRLVRVLVDVGDSVKPGQLLAELDPIDLDARISSQQAAMVRARTVWQDARAKRDFAATEARRYAALLTAGTSSAETASARAFEEQAAERALAVAAAELRRTEADLESVEAQRGNLRLVSPQHGRVSVRSADPGSTVVPGQSLLEIINPDSLWVTVRFDQEQARGLAVGLDATVRLRSTRDTLLSGRVMRVEPRADAVTEEVIARVVFTRAPDPAPAIGELVEVTVQLPAAAPAPVIANAAVQRRDGVTGVWTLTDGTLAFTPVTVGLADLDGRVQLLSGVSGQTSVVVHSLRPLTERSRVRVRPTLVGDAP